MNKLGFSLVELLVVVALLGGLSVATSRIFFAQLKGSEKTQNSLDLRQAGDRALLAMKNKVRNAQEISGSCSANMSSLTIVSRDPAANSYTSGETITTAFNCGPQIIMSESGGATVNLTPNDINVNSCSFDCRQGAGSPQKVNLKFELGKNGDSLSFSSTVSLRNF